jgi:hypothetical protein
LTLLVPATELSGSYALFTFCTFACDGYPMLSFQAANAFWNPRYYDPLKRTITKQLIYINDDQLLDEVRSLVWLAITTDRALILPNILGSEKLGQTFRSYNDQVR